MNKNNENDIELSNGKNGQLFVVVWRKMVTNIKNGHVNFHPNFKQFAIEEE